MSEHVRTPPGPRKQLRPQRVNLMSKINIKMSQTSLYWPFVEGNPEHSVPFHSWTVYLNVMKCLNVSNMNVLQHHEWMKNKHQPLCSSGSSVCFILQGSGSLMFSLSSLINSVFADFSSSWCSDARLHLQLMGNFQHLLVNCCGRSFTDHVTAVGGA